MQQPHHAGLRKLHSVQGGRHTCVVNSMKSNCPVCLEYLFDSPRCCSVLKCGHTVHKECLDVNSSPSLLPPTPQTQIAFYHSAWRKVVATGSGPPDMLDSCMIYLDETAPHLFIGPTALTVHCRDQATWPEQVLEISKQFASSTSSICSPAFDHCCPQSLSV